MNQEFVQRMKEALLQERQSVLESLAENNDDFKSIIRGSLSGDEVDITTDQMDLKMIQSMNEMDIERLSLINEALLRIEQGKYGICTDCGKEIPEGRLEYMPYTQLCVECKSAKEA